MTSIAKAVRPCALRSLLRDQRGLAMTEFAMALPILLVLMSAGLELTHYVIATKRIGEIAGQVGDNASRMGDQTAIRNKPISEAEINDVFIGAQLQAGSIDLERNGRIILSSLQRDEDDKQTIAWQRCFGSLAHSSSFGKQGEEAKGSQVTASPGTAVMVVEIAYEYERLVPLVGLPLGQITDHAAFNVRDDRDLSEIYNFEEVSKSTCE